MVAGPGEGAKALVALVLILDLSFSDLSSPAPAWLQGRREKRIWWRWSASRNKTFLSKERLTTCLSRCTPPP
jgi:hypothetical protein